MQLTGMQKDIAAGELGEQKARAMNMLLNVGDNIGAEGLIPVKEVFIDLSGLTVNKELGSVLKDEVTSMVDDDGFSVPTYFGPSSALDSKEHQDIAQIIESGGAVRLESSFPFTEGIVPNLGSHLCFSGPSVMFTNSYLGARTNREDTLVAIASAVSGLVHYSGLHLKEARTPDYAVKVRFTVSEADIPYLTLALASHMTDKHHLGRIPIIRAKSGSVLFEADVRQYHLNSLMAYLAMSTPTDIIHIEGHTPEANFFRGIKDHWDINMDREDIDSIRDEAYPNAVVDAIVLGWPPLSAWELRHTLSLLPEHLKQKVWLSTTEHAVNSILGSDQIEKLEKRSIGFITSSDPYDILAVLKEKYDYVVTDSPTLYSLMSAVDMKAALISVKDALSGGVLQ